MSPTTAAKTIKLTDVPIAQTVDLTSLKGDDALEVMAVFQPRSQADTTVLKALLAKAREGKLSGGKGHITAAEASHRFADPALHWVGGIELPDGRVAFRGLVDQAQADLARWIRAGQISFEPWAAGSAVALDAMPMNRATKGTPAVAATDDDSSVHEDYNDTAGDTSNTEGGASGEMTNNNPMDGMKVIRKSIVPAGEDMGEVLKPEGYGDAPAPRPQDTHVNETMRGVPTKRRQI